MPSDLATRYKTVKNLVARSKVTIRDVATARIDDTGLRDRGVMPYGTVGVLPNDLDGPRPNMPRGASDRTAGKFSVGDHVRVLPSHGFAHYRGDTGVIDKMIPINKAYVESEKNGRIIVDLDDLEKGHPNRKASLDDILKNAAFAFLRESKFSWLAKGMAIEAKKSGESLGMRDVAKALKAWFDGRKPEGSKEESGYRYIQSDAGRLLMNGLIKGVTSALKETGSRVGLKEVGEAIVAFAEGV